MRPYFFVSHAENDGDGVHVRNFFDDLQRALQELHGLQHRYGGQLRRLSHAFVPAAPASSSTGPHPGVLDCRAFVALYSNAYFSSEQCVTEWSLFYERMRWHFQHSGHKASSMIGILWSIDTTRLPDAVRAASRMPDAAAAEAHAGGVLELVRTARNAEPYRRLVREVAALVSAGADSGTPTMAEGDVRFVRPHPDLVAGLDGPGVRHPPDQPGTSGDGGDGEGSQHGRSSVRPRTGASMGRAGVVIGAAPAHKQPEERRHLEYYGSTAEDWRPYRPASMRPAYVIARDALGSAAIHDTVCYVVGEGLTSDLAHARDERRVVVVLVDPWLARSADYRGTVRELARHILKVHPVAATLVVVNPSDEETTSHLQELRVELRHQLLEGHSGAAARVTEVRKHEQLATKLVRIVIRAQHDLIREPPAPPAGADSAPGPTTDRPSQRLKQSGGDDRSKPILRRRRRDRAEQQT